MSTKVSPLFFIVDEVGHPTLTVDGSGRRPFKFNWEPDFAWKLGEFQRKGAYVLRFESVEDMLKQQFDILGHQRFWTVYCDVLVEETSRSNEFASNKVAATLKEKEALEQRVQRLEVALADAEEQFKLATRPAPPQSTAASFVEEEPSVPKMPAYGEEKHDAPTLASTAATTAHDGGSHLPVPADDAPEEEVDAWLAETMAHSAAAATSGGTALDVPPAPAAALDTPPAPAGTEDDAPTPSTPAPITTKPRKGAK